MRPIFWFIVLPVLIEALSSDEQSLSQVSRPEYGETTSLLSTREGKNLFDVFAKYAQKRQDTDGVNPDVADAITVGQDKSDTSFLFHISFSQLKSFILIHM